MNRVNLPKTFTAINLSEKGVFRDRAGMEAQSMEDAARDTKGMED
jgi:hypothetical protein